MNSSFAIGKLPALIRYLSAWIVLWVSIACGASNALKNLERINISGVDYVRLTDLSESTGMRLRWLQRDEEIEMTNRWCKFEFAIKDIKSELNGLDVRLSFPVILRNSVPLIAAVDVETALNPLLYPPKNSPGEKIEIICLDAGHGGKDTGKIDKRNTEKRFTLLLAEELGRQLKQRNFKIIYTRTRDQAVELGDRIAFANKRKADLFISLHYNSGPSDVRGVETYCLTPPGVESSNAGSGKSGKGNVQGNAQNSKNMLLAYTVHRAILQNTRLEDRGVKRARFKVLTDASMPAALIEGGFMTNQQDAKKIYDSEFRTKMAAAIVDGILAYKKVVEVPPPAPAPAPPVTATK